MTLTLLAIAADWMPAAAQTDGERVQKVVEALASFSEAKNLAGLDTLYAPEAWVHIIEGSGVNHGWADYRDHHLGPELREFKNFKYRYFAIEPQIRGTVAWTPFHYELSADMPNGHVDAEGRGTAVLERRDGRWLVVHLHTSGGRKIPK
ncbi:MAG: nuclear transport factor 2 family protein [Gemmatimonadota bacterium]